MEQLRLILLAGLAFIGVLLYQDWQKAAAPAQAQASPAVDRAYPQVVADDAIPAVASEQADAAPQVPGESAAVPKRPVVGDMPQDDIWVRTDVFEARISRSGADIHQLRLLNYPVSSDEGSPAFNLLDNSGRDRFFHAQSGIASTSGPTPLHNKSQWAHDGPNQVELASGQDSLPLTLTWTDPDGRRVERTYHFKRGHYDVEVTQTLVNQTETDWRASPYWRLVRDERTGGNKTPMVKTFTGVATYELDDGKYKFRKHSADDLEDESQSITQLGGWTGMLEHYFVAAILPPETENNRFFSRPYKAYPGAFLTEYVAEPIDVAPGASAQHSVRLFLGPKLQEELSAIAPGLELSVDYGLLTPISEPLFWVMDKIHGLVGNWGWSIILITLLIKALFFKLSETQYKSMARMKKFAPRIQQIKERYADDRQRLHQAMMDLYKKEGFNPLAGCWPMLVQFPVFIALYWVLLESVELRQADFVLWLTDLSSPDPLFVLPVLFGASMWLQQKLSGQAMTMEPMQQKIMNIMPVALAIFFTFFPSGLVLYWFVSNVIGIAQQWVITRRLEAE